jgi:hypothetical protein
LLEFFTHEVICVVFDKTEKEIWQPSRQINNYSKIVFYIKLIISFFKKEIISAVIVDKTEVVKKSAIFTWDTCQSCACSSSTKVM